jgi:hypothetical protein
MQGNLLCTPAAHSCLNKRVVYRLFLIFWFFLIKQKEHKRRYKILLVKIIHRPRAAIKLRVVTPNRIQICTAKVQALGYRLSWNVCSKRNE